MKKYVYIFAWLVLAMMLSFIAHAVIEIGYIKYALGAGLTITDYTVFGYAYCALPAWLQIGLLLAGISGGYFAGVYFWRIIYVEKRYRHWPNGK